MIRRICFPLIFVLTLAAQVSAQEPPAPTYDMQGLRQDLDRLIIAVGDQKQAIDKLTTAVADHQKLIENLEKNLEPLAASVGHQKQTIDNLTTAMGDHQKTLKKLSKTMRSQDWYYFLMPFISLLMPLIAAVTVGYAGWQYGLACKQHKNELEQQTLVRVSELRSLIETADVRRARADVMRKIRNMVKHCPDKSWWDDPNLHDSAAIHCSAYDHLGSLLTLFPNKGVGRFFYQRWGETAIRSRAILQSFLHHRRKEAPATYAGFDWFVREARLRHQKVAESAEMELLPVPGAVAELLASPPPSPTFST